MTSFLLCVEGKRKGNVRIGCIFCLNCDISNTCDTSKTVIVTAEMSLSLD